MQIQHFPLTAIKRYENNPRNNAAAVDRVAASIRDFGWQQPIVVDESMTIIVGDTRYQAAQKLGLDTVPVHVAIGLTPDQVRAYRLADNKTSEFATWDDSKLAEELAEVMESVGNIDMTAFSFSEYEALAMQAQADLAALTAGEDDSDTPADDEPVPLEPEDDHDNDPEDTGGENNAPMVPLNVLTPVEHRETVFDAINAAKEAHGIETTAEALFIICKEYLDV